MKHFFLFVFFLSSNVVICQMKTGVRAMYGRSIILNDQVPIRPPSDTYPTAYDHNFGGGVYLNYRLNKWLAIETSVSVEQMRSYEGYFVRATTDNLNADELEFDENGLADWYSNEQWIRLNYVSFPLGLSFETKRWCVGLGGQYSHLLKVGAARQDMSMGKQQGYIPFKWAESFNFHRRSNVSVYGLVGFKVWKKLRLEVTFLHGLIDISQEMYQARYWTRQLQFGLRYQIIPHEKIREGKR